MVDPTALGSFLAKAHVDGAVFGLRPAPTGPSVPSRSGGEPA